MRIPWPICFLLFVCFGCTANKQLTKGSVEPKEFNAKVSFTTAKSLVLIPCEIEGNTKNFIFDTGAQVTTIQRDSIFGEIITVRGGSNRTVENGSETVASLKIGEVDFINTFATNENEVELSKRIPNYGGILGRTVIDKANWLINYPEKTIELSNENICTDGFTDIPLLESSTTPYTFVEIDGVSYQAILDLGSTSVFNVPEDTELAKLLLSKYNFEKNTRERYTVGGTQNVTELIGSVPAMSIGDLTFTDVRVNINQSSQIRLGMPFFAAYEICIDNENHRYRIR
ncbi:pepsin/retropepsin-like aspartic protease family protein [Cryomorphaceae bacterium 1068]|nr:pepsin/retropepsin-like aspartic protease family protein [Cryomorphaceae bacterium 1068]